MISLFELYLFGQIPNIRIFFGMLIPICFFSMIAYLMYLEGKNLKKSVVATFVSIAMFAGLCLAFFPTQKTLAMMYVIPKIANSDFVQKDLPIDSKKIYKMAMKVIENKLTELSNDEKDKK